MRLLVAALLIVLPVFSFAHAQTPWKVHVTFHGCLKTPVGQGDCGSQVLVHNASTGEIYVCGGGEKIDGTSKPPRRTANILCHRFPSPITGPSELAAATPLDFKWDTYTKWQGAEYKEFINFFWIVGQRIEDLRFCATITKTCSGPPEIRPIP